MAVQWHYIKSSQMTQCRIILLVLPLKNVLPHVKHSATEQPYTQLIIIIMIIIVIIVIRSLISNVRPCHRSNYEKSHLQMTRKNVRSKNWCRRNNSNYFTRRGHQTKTEYTRRRLRLTSNNHVSPETCSAAMTSDRRRSEATELR